MSNEFLLLLNKLKLKGAYHNFLSSAASDTYIRTSILDTKYQGQGFWAIPG